MSLPDDQVLGQAARTQLVRLVRDHAGVFPGEDVLDLHSLRGFLGAGMAMRAPRWHILTTAEPEPADERPNLEVVDLDDELPELPFEDGSLAAVVGAFLTGAYEPWCEELASEIVRVLVPKGRVLLLVRGPSARAPQIERGLPQAAADQLGEAGLKRAVERRLSHLLDGSEVRLVEGTHPW